MTFVSSQTKIHIILDAKSGLVYKVDAYSGSELEEMGSFEDFIRNSEHSVAVYVDSTKSWDVGNWNPQADCIQQVCLARECEACMDRWAAKVERVVATLTSIEAKRSKNSEQ